MLIKRWGGGGGADSCFTIQNAERAWWVTGRAGGWLVKEVELQVS